MWSIIEVRQRKVKEAQRDDRVVPKNDLPR
jgi:hypothetical protein